MFPENIAMGGRESSGSVTATESPQLRAVLTGALMDTVAWSSLPDMAIFSEANLLLIPAGGIKTELVQRWFGKLLPTVGAGKDVY